MSNQTFSVHPRNPRCFLYRGKPFKILTSAEHYGAALNTAWFAKLCFSATRMEKGKCRPDI